MYVQGKKTIICLKCCCNLMKSGKCVACKSGDSHVFDSRAESERYTHLKRCVTDIQVQFKFPIYVPLMKLDGSFANQLPKEFTPTENFVHVMDYKIDFYYIDPLNPKGCVFEEFKPSKQCKKTKKFSPIINADASVKLRLLASSVTDRYDVFVSYPDNNAVGGYSKRLIKPVEK